MNEITINTSVLSGIFDDVKSGITEIVVESGVLWVNGNEVSGVYSENDFLAIVNKKQMNTISNLCPIFDGQVISVLFTGTDVVFNGLKA